MFHPVLHLRELLRRISKEKREKIEEIKLRNRGENRKTLEIDGRAEISAFVERFGAGKIEICMPRAEILEKKSERDEI